MFYKVSNTSRLTDLETAFQAKFKYPFLYQPTPMINGLTEATLPVITKAAPNRIDYAIWGLLPADYKENWSHFQNLSNTLNISIHDFNHLNWITPSIQNQRCVVLVSGFFTSYLYNGEIYPFYVYQKDHKPFALAAIYSVLNDGFLSFSLVTSPAKKHDIKDIHNLSANLPIVIEANRYKDWLNYTVDLATFGSGKIGNIDLKAHAISKMFYNHQISNQQILEPAYYNDLPILAIG